MDSTFRKRSWLSRQAQRCRVFDGLVFGLVFVAVFGMVLMHALPLPRIYRSSVTVAISSDASAQGWEPLRAADLPSWLPGIAPRVARRFENRREGEAFLKPYGTGGQDRLARITELIGRDMNAVYDEKTQMTTVSFRHPDFKVAGEVVSWAGHEYLSHLQREEADDRTKLNERWARQMSEIEALKRRAAKQAARLDTAALALQAFRERHNRMGKRETQLRDVGSGEEEYERLVAAVQEAEVEYKADLDRMRDLSMSVGMRSPVRIVNSSGWAASHDYVFAPLVVRALWGGAVALGCGVGAVLLASLMLWMGGRCTDGGTTRSRSWARGGGGPD